MQLINGRTAEQWRAYDRWKLIVAVVLALLLLVLWLADRGPGRAAACCAVPGTDGAAVAPPPAAAPATPPPATPRPEVALPAEAAETPPGPDCPQTIDVEVLFASSSARITAAGGDELGALVPCLAEGRFEIAGHADSSATDAINIPLAEARARAVVDYLVSQGVDAGRLTARGLGSSQPLVDNATPEGRAQNRRVEIRER